MPSVGLLAGQVDNEGVNLAQDLSLFRHKQIVTASRHVNEMRIGHRSLDRIGPLADNHTTSGHELFDERTFIVVLRRTQEGI
jgi:hypothetical protein